MESIVKLSLIDQRLYIVFKNILGIMKKYKQFIM